MGVIPASSRLGVGLVSRISRSLTGCAGEDFVGGLGSGGRPRDPPRRHSLLLCQDRPALLRTFTRWMSPAHYNYASIMRIPGNL